MSREVVGRESERRSIADFLAGLGDGPATLLIEGEAGIGKTTLWLEAVAAAEAQHFRVLQARPAEREPKLSYAALADLIGAAFDETRIALPAPQERALSAALLRDDASGPADARATAAGFVNILTTLATKSALLIAIDDVQWLDAGSESALAFAARRMPARAGLLLTRRAEAAPEAPLGLVGAPPGARVDRLVPQPLPLAAMHHVIKGQLGLSLPRPLLVRLTEASGGNPFFALEMARSLAPDADVRSLTDPLPVPPSVQELVKGRLGRLSASARETLLVIAALSRADVETVAATLAPGIDAEPALIEAEEAGLLTSHRGRIRFAHPLLASVVYASASDTRRRGVHRHLAEIVTEPEQRARHLAQCTTEPDEATAAELERGARQAAMRGAQNASAELFEESHRLTPADRPDELARRLLGHASALNALGEYSEARSLSVHALVSARDPEARIAGLSLLGTLAWFGGDAAAATHHLEGALSEAADDRRLQGPIYAKLVRFTFTLAFERAIEHADAAMQVLDEEREPLLLAHVLIDRFWAGTLLGRPVPRELLDRGLELEAAALPAGSEAPHPIPLIWFWCADELDAARARHAMEDEWYRDRGEEVWQADRRAHLAPIELRAGNWELAEQYVEESCAVLERADVGGPMLLAFEKRALVDAHRGRIERARATLRPMIEGFERRRQAWWAVLCLSTLAFVEFAAGDLKTSDGALARMQAHAESLGARDVVQDRSEPFHIESLVALGEMDRAREVLARLDERGRVLPRLWISVTLPRARALVLAGEGDVPAALQALDGLDVELASRLPFELGWTLLLKGRLLRRMRQKRAAADALTQAVAVFEGLSAPAWIDQARGELQRVGLRPPAPDKFTESERRVAELVAKGLTNRETAAQLFMSPKTVEATLGRIYRKLDIHSRAELGAQIASNPAGPEQMQGNARLHLGALRLASRACPATNPWASWSSATGPA